VLAPLAAALLVLVLGAGPGAWDDEPPQYEAERIRHVQLTAWGGGSLLLDSGSSMTPFLGAEAGWSFGWTSLSLLWEQHRYGRFEASRPWTQVILARLEQRIQMSRQLETGLVLGLGVGRPDRSWVSWFQFGLSVKLPLDPVYLRGELGLERSNNLRLGAGVGFAF